MRHVVLLLLWLGLSLCAQAEERLALVIGNSAYDADAGGYLANPVRDADTVAAALRDVGFDVTLKKNLDDKALKRVIRDHRQRIENAGSGVVNFFYFAGHGANDSELDFGGANYIIPIGANLQSIRDLSIEAVELGDAIKAFSRAAVSFVVFDACRNYPFGSSSVRSAIRGFTPERELEGTFIAFSSRPGSVALDESGYASALATALRTPGLDHRDIFTRVRSDVYDRTEQRQFSWFRDGILGDVIFREGQNQPTTPPPPPIDAESVLWGELRGSCSGLQAYVDRYPSGRFASTARSKLNQSPCKAAPSPPPANTAVQTPTKSAEQALSDGLAAYEAKDYRAALTKFQTACDAGVARGCNGVGVMYREGQVVAQSNTIAVELFQKACDDGSMHGCLSLGGMYQSGKGVTQSHIKAVELYRKACDSGEAGGCANLGFMYRHGNGVTKSQDRAISLFRAACDEGNAFGCGGLASMYWGGLGVKRSRSEAARYAKISCDGGYEIACRNLKIYQGN